MTIEEIKTNRRKQLVGNIQLQEKELITFVKDILGQSFDDVVRRQVNYDSWTVSVWFKNHNEIIIGKTKDGAKFYVADKLMAGHKNSYINFADALIAAEKYASISSNSWWQFWK